MRSRWRRRWVLAKLQREARESWYWHRGVWMSFTFPVRRPALWWFFRRVRRAIAVGETIIEA